MLLRRITVILVVAAATLALAAEPFVWNTTTNGTKLEATVTVAPGAYLDRDSIVFEVHGTGKSAVTLTTEPRSASHTDPETGAVSQILGPGRHVWSWSGNPPFFCKVGFQGCKSSAPGIPALCLLPETLLLLPRPNTPAEQLEADFELLPERLSGFRLVRKSEGLLPAAQFNAFLSGASTTGSESDAAAAMLAGLGLFAMFFAVLVGGISLNLTPCVLPMIPVNLAIIGAGASRRTGLRRGLAYGGGMAAAYGGLGLAVILAGARFGQLNSSSTFNFVIAAVFAILAAAMLGVFRIDFSGHVNVKPSRLPGGAMAVAFILGALAALLAGACVAPVVIGVLIFAAERYQNGELAALALPFILGLGMGLPWPLAGAGIGVLPKPGRFMNAVKYVFAALILLAAIYYGYIGYTLLPGRYSAPAEFAKLDSALAEAEAARRPVLIDFWASWCKNCAAMDRSTFQNSEVKTAMKNFVVVKFQAEKLDDPAIRALLDRFGIAGLPAFAILEPR